MNEFFAGIYELLYYGDAFSNDLFSENIYFLMGIFNLITALLFVLAFYYLINRPSFSRWYHWLLIMLLGALLNFMIAFLLSNNKFK